MTWFLMDAAVLLGRMEGWWLEAEVSRRIL